MSRVLIIGNGFDLDLGLKTSYSSFFKSDYFPKEGNALIKHLNERIQFNNWIDLENELKSFVSNGKYMKGYEDLVLKDYEIVCKSLFEYLKKINYSSINIDSYAYKLLKITSEDTNAIIFNYNYTAFFYILENLLKKDMNYNQIHGSINSGSIILGFEDDVEILDDFTCMIKSHNPAYRSYNIRNTLLKSDEIIFFGHSLGMTDYHYFQDLFLRQSGNLTNDPKEKKIRIFTLDEKSRLDILLQLREMNYKNTNKLYDLNDFRVFKTKEDHDDIQKYFEELKENINFEKKVHIVPI